MRVARVPRTLRAFVVLMCERDLPSTRLPAARLAGPRRYPSGNRAGPRAMWRTFIVVTSQAFGPAGTYRL
jgi:hypothetical protein